MKSSMSALLVAVVCGLGCGLAGAEITIVRDGNPVATVWHYGDAGRAAADLVEYVGKISGAKLEVQVEKGQKPDAGQAAIVLGDMARDMGLPAPPKTPSQDGYRILTKGNLILMAGESEASTFFATSHFLETLGVRWFFDNALGTVVPEMKTINVGALDVAEKPDFISRSIWGPNWRGAAWGAHNRMGGMNMPTGHDWGHVPAAQYGKEHPEYYALRGGKRSPGNWLCTSNPEVHQIFAQSIISQVKDKGTTAVSISPPDGRGYCQCEKCTAQDDPGYIEPSSGSVAISDRYQEFYNSVAKRVLLGAPDCILNFYAYADYSVPPKRVRGAPPNLCAWIAPIRFCRLHSLSNPICASRQRCREVVDGWGKAVSKIGWREYNYNLAEDTVPLSKISIFKDDLAYLHKQGCLGINIETMAFWHIYGPHTYLVTRLSWDAEADVDAIMNDFYEKFCGKAAPHVKAYWERMDKAYCTSKAHAGSFYAVHAVWTPQLIQACQADLDAAAKAADNETIKQRVAMFQMGLDNAKYYASLREATNRCDFPEAKEIYDKWLAHMDNVLKEGIHRISEYKYGYAPRFLAAPITQGLARSTGNCKMLVQLPDEWLFRYDPNNEGEKSGWHARAVVPRGWQKVKTYSATLGEQGVEEQLTWMWYWTSFQAPARLPDGPIHMWFAETDARGVKVWLNGQDVGGFAGKRQPGEVDITGKLRPGRQNVVAVRIDHSSISELMLGGIIKPVMVYSGKAE